MAISCDDFNASLAVRDTSAATFTNAIEVYNDADDDLTAALDAFTTARMNNVGVDAAADAVATAAVAQQVALTDYVFAETDFDSARNNLRDAASTLIMAITATL